MSARKRPAKRASAPDINVVIRQVQRMQAVLICLQVAAEEGAEADMADALAVIVVLVAESLASLDMLETRMEVRHGN
jgi:hypothetical protein